MINKTDLITVVGVVYMVMSTVLYSQPTAPQGKKWEAVPLLTDEFNFWDNTKWYKELWNYPPPVSMQAKNGGVENGKLWIKATLGPNQNRWFETCRIYSKAQIKFPMYTECKMKTAHISAFNTFWLNNGNSNNRDEIDICENVSNPNNTSGNFKNWPYIRNSQYFIVKNGVEERRKANFDNRNLSNNNAMKGKKWNEKYHVLGLFWKDANTLEFYINGEKSGVLNSTKKFTLTQNIIWDLWTSPESWFPGLPPKTDLLNNNINTMYVDWIHTYKLIDKDPIPTNEKAVIFRKNNAMNFGIDGGNGGSNGQNVNLWSYQPDNGNQLWVEINRGSGYYSYKKKNTNFCIDGGNGGANGQSVKLWTCNANNQNQQWKKVNLGNGRYRLEKRNTSAYSISGGTGGANGQNLFLQPSNNNNKNQQWILEQVEKALFSERRALKKDTNRESFPLTVYPNPVLDKLNINLSGIILESDAIVVEIYSISGNLIKTMRLKNIINQVSLKELTSGMYLIKVSNGNSINTRFIIKE